MSGLPNYAKIIHINVTCTGKLWKVFATIMDFAESRVLNEMRSRAFKKVDDIPILNKIGVVIYCIVS